MLKKIMIIALTALITATSIALAETMPYYIEVDCVNNIVTVYSTEDDSIVRQMICSTGVAMWPSPHGTFYMPKQHKQGERGEWYKFEDGYGKYGSRIQGNFLFHSYLFDSPDDSTIRLDTYAALGTNASHGCVRLLIDDAKWVADNCFAGTKVRIYDGKTKLPYLKEKLHFKTFSVDDGHTYEEFMSIAVANGDLGYLSEGEDVSALQKRLSDLGLYSGGIDGVYGGDMVKSVKAIQAIAGLEATGVADAAFIEYISSDSAPISLTATLSTGARGNSVRVLQMLLKLLGLYTGELTGEFDVATYEAARLYQRGNGLNDTGVISGEAQMAMVKQIAALTDMYGVGGYAAVFSEISVETGVANSKSRLNVRAEPSQDSDILGKLDLDLEVNIDRREGEWYRISLDGYSGYVMCKYMTISKSTRMVYEYVAADAEHPGITCDMPIEIAIIGSEAVSYGTVNTSERLKIRESPDYQAEVVLFLVPGSIVTVLSEADGWARISYGGVSGYTRAELLDIVVKGELTGVSEKFGGEYGAFDAMALLPDALSASYALIINPAGTYLRETAFDNGLILDILEPNARVEALMVTAEWTQVNSGGIIGYVSNSDVYVGTADELNKYSAESE